MSTQTQAAPALRAFREPPADPESVRGYCVMCQDLMVSECVYVDGRGFLIWWRCLGCQCRRIL